jgi:membrane associated rhomboid family serine protease
MQEFRPSRFQILPLIIKNLLIINGLIFFAQNTIGGGDNTMLNMDNLFALHTFQSPLFKPWQLVTHIFMHGDFGHLFSNMFALWMFGSILENVWGPKRFLIFYISCGLGAALCHMGVLYYESEQMIHEYNTLTEAGLKNFIIKYGTNIIGSVPLTLEGAKDVVILNLNEATLGASGAVFGCLAAFGFLFPNTLIYLYFFIPLKAKWFVIGYALIELFAGIRNSAGDNIAHFAHLGGALVGLILVYTWNKRNRKTFY